MTSPFDPISIPPGRLPGRSFILGNKRALCVCLPACPGRSASTLHRHKWFGVYLYGRKFLEGQVVRVGGRHVSPGQQRGFTMGLTSARREYVVDGQQLSEEYFMPDGIGALAVEIRCEVPFSVEPEFDIRSYLALADSVDGYEVEYTDRGAVVSGLIPDGTYDDRSETFHADGCAGSRAWVAVEIVGDEGRVERMPQGARRKLFTGDRRRQDDIKARAPEGSRYDHAPLWSRSESTVYAPLRLHGRQSATIVYGFGASREEALSALTALRDNPVAYRSQKAEAAREVLSRASFETGNARVDAAHAHVLTRLGDALVARHATAEDTALDGSSTMILAGNRYFHDAWKRDENIAVGFLLSLGFYDLARDVIRDTWQLQDPVTGRLPQRIRSGEDPPYHSSDGTLWALLRLHQYRLCTGDESLLRATRPMVQHFFTQSLDSLRHGLLPSGGTVQREYLWETWMDTEHTPRDGFPVEIQMLWLAVLQAYRPYLPELGERMDAAETAGREALSRFIVRGRPADSLTPDGEPRDLTTPNPYFAFALGLDMGPDIERTMRHIGRRELRGTQGIATLSPQDWPRVYSPEFLQAGHVRGRRMRSVGKFNYHRGVEWNWLAQFFVRAELKYGEPDAAYRYVRPQVQAALERGGIGGISELFDLSGPRGPEFQAWSMAGFLEGLHAFAGVYIDVPAHRIEVAPQLPAAWPHLSVRKWYGTIPFDVVYRRDGRDLALHISFPGDVPDAEIEVVLVVPRRGVCMEVMADGRPGAFDQRTNEIDGGGTRARLRLRATQHISVRAKNAARSYASGLTTMRRYSSA